MDIKLSLQPPTLNIIIPNSDKLYHLYNRIQVFRSPDNQTYIEITAEDYTPAQIVGTISGPFNLNGTSLTIQKEQLSWTINFTSTMDSFSVRNLINTTVNPDIVEVKNNRLVVTSDYSGTGSWLSLSGTACPILGLSTTKTYGKGARYRLAPETEVYEFLDLSDVITQSWYKIRLYNNQTGRYSDYSEAVQYTPPDILDSSNFVTGNLQLSDISGRPTKGIRIVISPVVYSNITGVSILNYQKQVIKETDYLGRAELKLLKGSTIRVDIEGTNLGREIIVPQNNFNILSTLATYPDPMNIQPARNYPVVLS